MVYNHKVATLHAKAFGNTVHYREVANGVVWRELIAMRHDDGTFTVLTYTTHMDKHRHYPLNTQREVSELTANYFGL